MYLEYIVKDNKIIYPISNIKSIGTVICDSINKAKQDGEFIDIYDCFRRLYIAGIGKKRKINLVKEFETIDNIKNASIEELAKIEGMNQKTAENVYNYYH